MFGRVVSFQGKAGKTGKAMVVAVWDSEKDLQASHAATAQLRAQATQIVGAVSPPTVEIYETAASVGV
jgi:hypothetical protein